MKNLQQNLFIVLALGLCALCAYQWYGQAAERQRVEALNQVLSTRAAAIQTYTNAMRTMDGQIAQMEGRLGEYKEVLRTNDLFILKQKQELTRARAENEALNKQILEYKQAVESFDARLKEVSEGVKKQNDAIKDLAAQRDDYAEKLSASVKERNKIVAEYNDLVVRFGQLQTNRVKGGR